MPVEVKGSQTIHQRMGKDWMRHFPKRNPSGTKNLNRCSMSLLLRKCKSKPTPPAFPPSRAVLRDRGCLRQSTSNLTDLRASDAPPGLWGLCQRPELAPFQQRVRGYAFWEEDLHFSCAWHVLWLQPAHLWKAHVSHLRTWSGSPAQGQFQNYWLHESSAQH